MNWIERLYEIEQSGRKDFYSQNGEGLYLEYVISRLQLKKENIDLIDIGGGDGFYLSNTRHLAQLFNIKSLIIDKEWGHFVTRDNILGYFSNLKNNLIVSIDIDGNDYWVLEVILKSCKPEIVIAEFNPAFIDSRTIKYNPDHLWDGTDYYGFSFEAGNKLAEANGYKIIFEIANTNIIMVREDFINVPIPPVVYLPAQFFTKSNRPDSDWVFV